MKKPKPYQRFLWLIMRVSLVQILLMTTLTSLVSASALRGQEILERKVSLHVDHADVEAILSQLEERASVSFTYRSKLFKDVGKMSINVDNVPLGSVLEEILDPRFRVYVLEHANAIVLARSAEATSGSVRIFDRISVTGIVRNEEGEPLPGANVVIKGSAQGVVTGVDGSYVIEVPSPETVLVFSFVGYKSQEVTVGSQTLINITLIAEVASLDEVVVVGYGEQNKENLTGSVVSIRGSDISSRHVGQTSMALQGIAPGVTVVQRSGQPGKDRGTIRIRGIGTLGDSNPLVLVDNVEMDINNIDPSIIESISILKDAASASIYGSRAANGVILITTKRAKNKTFSVNYSGYTGFQKPTDLPAKVNAKDHMILLNTAYTNAGKTALFDENLINNYNQLHKDDPARYPDVDWQEQVYTNNGFTQSHSLNLSGGSDNASLMAGIGYYKQGGLVENTGFERYSLRLNSDIRFNDKLSSKIDLFLRQMESREPGAGIEGDNAIVYWVNRMPATQLAVLPNGLYGVGWEGDNPYAMAEVSGRRRTLTPSVMINVGLEYKLARGLSLSANYSPHFWNDDLKHFRKSIPTYFAEGKLAYVKPTISTLSESHTRNRAHNLRATAVFDRTFGDHFLRILGGYQEESLENRWISAYRGDFVLPDYDVLGAGSQDNQSSDGSGYDWALRSFFGRVNYDFSGKYLFEANLRYDGSSRFARGHKWGVFPSFSIGWRLSDESFWSSVKSTISNMKLRASWGELGNQNIGTYPFDSFVSLNAPFVFNGVVVNGAALTAMANSSISWETTRMVNVGMDATLFNSLSLTFDYYVKNTSGILLQLDVPKIIGLSAPFQNAGEVENKGWDLALNYSGSVRDFSYDVGFVLSDVHNKILDLKGITNTGLVVNNEGEAMQSILALEAIGFFKDEDDIANHAVQYGNYKAGDIKYKDQLTIDSDGDGIFDAADGVINDDDKRIVGNSIPRFTFGLTANMSWRGFDLSVLLQGVGKADGYLYAHSVMPFYLGGTALEMHKDYWTPENTNATFPRLVFNEPNNEKHSTFWLKNAAYMRLKNLQLGYRLPSNLVERIGIKRARLYVSGQNLFSIDDFWDGFDVEAPIGIGSYYPQVKVYSLGVDLTL
jgi:TonB-linked SusC/RagA family outer membrane protein